MTFTADSGVTHLMVPTEGCGDIIVPVDSITLHESGTGYRMLVRGDNDWKEISMSTFEYLKSVIGYI